MSALPEIVPALPEVAWPTVPGAGATGMLALLFELERTQWLDPDSLARHQRRQLAQVLGHARRTSPFYEAYLAGVDLDDTTQAFAELPTLSRATVQDAGDALSSRQVPADHGDVVHYASSGSTGRPLRVRGTRLNDLWWRALSLRDHLWQQRDFSGKLAVIRTRIRDRTAPSWGAPTAGVFETGPCVSLSSEHGIDAQARRLVAENPHYLLTQASNLEALARYCAEHGLRWSKLREVRSYGETLPEGLRALCREAWDVPLVDTYSAAEVGVIALQCPERAHYHVQSEHLVVEILDDDDQPCAAGEVGRVVVTALHNFAMPLVRYELNDYAEVGAPCACGRGLPVLKRILGRRRNMLRLPDGSRHWPSFPVSVWGEDTPVRQVRLVQAELEVITVNLVVTRALTAAERAAIETRLSERLGWPFRYRFEFPEHLDAGPGYTDFVCLLDDD